MRVTSPVIGSVAIHGATHSATYPTLKGKFVIFTGGARILVT